MADKLIFILGGARSGKSSHAQQLALALGGADVLFMATAEARDAEMCDRIAAHRAERPAGWRTVEAPMRVAGQIGPAAAGARVVLVDCLTLLVSNVMLAAGDETSPQQAEAAALTEIDALLAAICASPATWIVVSNEVGLGLVPPYPLGRVYRDALGRANQRFAAAADQVLFMVAGLPLQIK